MVPEDSTAQATPASPAIPQPVSEKGGMAVPREKTTKITVTPESFLVSWHSWLLLPLGNGLAFG